MASSVKIPLPISGSDTIATAFVNRLLRDVRLKNHRSHPSPAAKDELQFMKLANTETDCSRYIDVPGDI
jgi:hypothetical protein